MTTDFKAYLAVVVTFILFVFAVIGAVVAAKAGLDRLSASIPAPFPSCPCSRPSPRPTCPHIVPDGYISPSDPRVQPFKLPGRNGPPVYPNGASVPAK